MAANSQKSIVMLVSGGRTGTQFFGDRISLAISQCFSVHDPDVLSIFLKRNFSRIRAFGFRHMVLDRVLCRAGLRSTGQLLLRGKLTDAEAIRRVRLARESYYDRIEEPLIVESNTQWLHVLELLPSIWPQAKVVVIVRDPRTWIRSWLNKGFHQRPYDPARWFPPGRYTPSMVGDNEWESDWVRLDTFGRLAWEWRYVYSRLRKFVREHRQAEIYRFEDLFAGPLTLEMRRLVEFAANHDGREFSVRIPSDFGAIVKNASKGNAADWSGWSRKQRGLVESMCGELMADFGYLTPTGRSS